MNHDLHPDDRRAFRLRWGFAFGAGAGIVVLASLPPFVGPGLREPLMQFFSVVCHQLPGRSPHVDGISLAVCHRCYGIYWGLPLAAFAFLFLRGLGDVPRRLAPWVLAASLVPLSVDWGLDMIGLWSNTPASRTATGLLFGLVAGWFFVRGITEIKHATASPG